MYMTDLIGYAAACFTTFALVPQIMRIWRLKEARDVSMFMPVMIGIGSTLWTIYGFLIASIPVVAANSVSLVMALLTISFTMKYR